MDAIEDAPMQSRLKSAQFLEELEIIKTAYFIFLSGAAAKATEKVRGVREEICRV